MAYVKPYFQAPQTGNVPIFTAVWNGFMMERTSMNMQIVAAELKNMGSDALLEREKILLDNIKEYTKIVEEARGKNLEVKQELTKTALQHKAKMAQIAKDKLIGREDQYTKRQEAIGKFGQTSAKLSDKLMEAQYNITNFRGATARVDFDNIVEDFKSKGQRLGVDDTPTPPEYHLTRFDRDFVNPLLKEAGMSPVDRATAPERKAYQMIVAANLYENFAKQIPKKAFDPEYQQFNESMLNIFKGAGFPNFKPVSNASEARTAGMELIEELRTTGIQRIDPNEVQKLLLKADASFPTQARLYALQKHKRKVDQQVFLKREQLQLGFNQYKAEQEAEGFQEGIDFDIQDYFSDLGPRGIIDKDAISQSIGDVEGSKRTYGWIQGEIERTKAFTRSPGGSSKEQEVVAMAYELDPVWAKHFTGVDLGSKGNLSKIRSGMTAQAQLDAASDDLAALRVKRAARSSFERTQGGTGIFKRFKSNYLMDNPFKTRNSRVWQTAGKFATEFKKLSIQPEPGQEKSVEFEGLDRGVDYNIPDVAEYSIGITRDDLPYMKEKSTGNITILDKSDANYQRFTKVLRQRMMRQVAEQRKKLEKK
jgi:hypothetical protein